MGMPKGQKMDVEALKARLGEGSMPIQEAGEFLATTVWNAQLDANYWKSLDTRSFYFKTEEKRLTTYKNFMLELKKHYCDTRWAGQ